MQIQIKFYSSSNGKSISFTKTQTHKHPTIHPLVKYTSNESMFQFSCLLYNFLGKLLPTVEAMGETLLKLRIMCGRFAFVLIDQCSMYLNWTLADCICLEVSMELVEINLVCFIYVMRE